MSRSKEAPIKSYYVLSFKLKDMREKGPTIKATWHPPTFHTTDAAYGHMQRLAAHNEDLPLHERSAYVVLADTNIAILP